MITKDGDEFTPTGIDLGDDLIEKTAPIPGQAAPAPEEKTESERIAPSIQNARILLNEGFLEEAKKVLRQVLLDGPGDVEARKLLQEIQDSELKQIFATTEPSRKAFQSNYDESILHADSEEIVRLLDRELGLGFDNLEPGLEPRLFLDHEVDRALGDSPRDRIDFAIAYIEMGLFSGAIRVLQPLAQHDSEADRINACALMACAHLLKDEPFQTVSVLQAILNDSEIAKAKKTECFYLMGRAQQATAAYADAIGWYLQAQGNDPGYRDSAERISRCKTALLRDPNSTRK